MKKTYIEPKNTIVRLNIEQMMCKSAEFSKSSASNTGTGVTDVTPEYGTQGLSREVIRSRGAWEEW